MTQPTLQQLADCLTAGMEGGINYWAAIAGYEKPEKITFTAHPDLGEVFPHIDYPMNGGAVLIIENDDEPDEHKKRHRLTLDSLREGARLMAEKYPQHYHNLLSESECDAETGDVLIQLALFGEIVYG